MIFDDFLSHRRGEQISPEDRQALESSVDEVRSLPARMTLVQKGETVNFSTYLVEGLICRYMDDREGLRQLVAVHVPGDFVDLHAYPLKHLDHDVATLTVCKVATVPHRNLDILMRERPELAKLLWFSTLLDAAVHREWIFRLGRLNAIARVGHFFCEIEAKLRAVGLSDGISFELAMTQNDLGEACGITAVHRNRMLRTLKERGLLQMRASQVQILNRLGLARLSEFDPAYLFIDE
ncbi:Crp/Fnr family transcriptional regulator [Sphingobium sp. H39-3-25]|uniref:Crp/Fnr family transcriptional regulator n=1 Tax=Sphingobium arseniciresistens TaxID=3030834 RepID=UPI0023B899AB|nr:Crp/Fnr family transcriptional regulator [Sphingobium arseniciresistens]